MVIVISEFTPDPPVERSLADTIFTWSKTYKASLIVTSTHIARERRQEQASVLEAQEKYYRALLVELNREKAKKALKAEHERLKQEVTT